MKFLNKSKRRIASTIFLTVFAAVAVVGFIRPLFASEMAGTRLVLSKQSVYDPQNTFALLDSNFIEGGHMQVPTRQAMLGYGVTSPGYTPTSTLIVYVTPERRKVGMLVTVLDDSPLGDGSVGPATYRLIHNESKDDFGVCHQLSTTDRSADGNQDACFHTQSGDWAVVIPSITSSMAAGHYILVATTTSSSSTDYEFALVPDTGTSTGAGGITSLTGTVVDNLFTMTTSGSTPVFTLNNQPAGMVFAGPVSATGTPLFRYLTPNDIWLGDGVHGILPAANGGTGADFSTTTVGSLIYTSGTSTSDGHFLSLGIGSNGQILTVDCSTGTCLPVWGDQNGGLFPSAAGAVTMDGWTGVSGNTFGTASTTLSQFIQNVFFPALAPTISISVGGSGGSYEWGATPPSTIGLTITKRTGSNILTSVTLTPSGSFTTDAVSLSSFSSPYPFYVSTSTSATGTRTINPGIYGLSSTSSLIATYNFVVGSISTGSTPPVSASIRFLPKVYYGKSFNNLMSSTFIDDSSLVSTTSLSYQITHLPTGSLQTTRAVPAQNYTNSSTTAPMWVYFAWPAYNYPDPAFSPNYEADVSTYGTTGRDAMLGPSGCKAITSDGTASNDYASPGTDCFYSGPDYLSLHADSAFKHRSVFNFTNAQGIPMHYELYQSESFQPTSGISTVGFQVQ